MMTRNLSLMLLAATAAALYSKPAFAEVKKQDAGGFLVSHIAEVEASPEALWNRLIKPKDWWNKEHSWSGSTDGFYISPQAGGCFCESIKGKDKDGKDLLIGSVEHMRVIHANSGKTLRMSGALGPLQSEAVVGTLTVAIEPVQGKPGITAISFNYIVGGYMRFETATMAKAVDRVIGEQFAGLLQPFAVSGNAKKKEDVFKLDIDGITGSKEKKDGKAKPGTAEKPPEVKIPPTEKGR
jgi:hypothetical protein